MKNIKLLILFYLFLSSLQVSPILSSGFSSLGERMRNQERKVSNLERRLIEINTKLAGLKDNNAKNDLLSQKAQTEIEYEFAEKFLLDLKGIEAKSQLAKAAGRTHDIKKA